MHTSSQVETLGKKYKKSNSITVSSPSATKLYVYLSLPTSGVPGDKPHKCCSGMAAIWKMMENNHVIQTPNTSTLRHH